MHERWSNGQSGQDGQVDQDGEDSQIDQDGQDQEPNDQPATSSIYLARQGLVAILVAARTDFSTFEDQRQQKLSFRGFWRIPSLF